MTLSKSKLALHTQAQHLKIKMYTCDECPFATAYGSLLKEHAIKQHRPDEMLSCRYECGYRHAFRSKVRRHEDTVHGVAEAAFQTANEEGKVAVLEGSRRRKGQKPRKVRKDPSETEVSVSDFM